MSEQEKIDALHEEMDIAMTARRAKEEAREHARLLTEWADGKTLQRHYGAGIWGDYEGKWYPTIYNVANWRVKPEPRRAWSIGNCITEHANIARQWRDNEHTVTEWMEVLP